MAGDGRSPLRSGGTETVGKLHAGPFDEAFILLAGAAGVGLWFVLGQSSGE